MHESSAAWIVEVVVDAEAAESVADLLWVQSPTSVWEDPRSSSLAPLRAGDANEASLMAGYTKEAAAQAAAEAIRAHATYTRLSVTEATGQNDWAGTWRRTAEPFEAGQFYVRLEHHPVNTDTKASDLVIEPGPTFGYNHPSTQLVLRCMDPERIRNSVVADVGTGSGILAVAAGLSGAATVDAVDVDPVAVEVAGENATRNSCDIRVLEGSVSSLPEPGYDLILANVTAGLLVELAPDLDSRLRPGGTLIVSGLLADQLDRVRAAFESPIGRVDHLDGWASATFEPHP